MLTNVDEFCSYLVSSLIVRLDMGVSLHDSDESDYEITIVAIFRVEGVLS